MLSINGERNTHALFDSTSFVHVGDNVIAGLCG